MSIAKETFIKAGVASLSFDDSLRSLVASSFRTWIDFVGLSQTEKDSGAASGDTGWEGYTRERSIERFIVASESDRLSSNELFSEIAKRAPQVVGSVGRALDLKELKNLQPNEYEVVLRYEYYATPTTAQYIDQGGLVFILAATHGAFEQYHRGIWSPLSVTDEKYAVAGGIQLQLTSGNRVQAFKYRVIHDGAMMLTCHVRFKGAALKTIEKHAVGYKSLSREFSEAWRRATTSN